MLSRRYPSSRPKRSIGRGDISWGVVSLVVICGCHAVRESSIPPSNGQGLQFARRTWESHPTSVHAITAANQAEAENSQQELDTYDTESESDPNEIHYATNHEPETQVPATDEPETDEPDFHHPETQPEAIAAVDSAAVKAMTANLELKAPSNSVAESPILQNAPTDSPPATEKGSKLRLLADGDSGPLDEVNRDERVDRIASQPVAGNNRPPDQGRIKSLRDNVASSKDSADFERQPIRNEPNESEPLETSVAKLGKESNSDSAEVQTIEDVTGQFPVEPIRLVVDPDRAYIEPAESPQIASRPQAGERELRDRGISLADVEVGQEAKVTLAGHHVQTESGLAKRGLIEGITSISRRTAAPHSRLEFATEKGTEPPPVPRRVEMEAELAPLKLTVDAETSVISPLNDAPLRSVKHSTSTPPSRASQSRLRMRRD